MESRPQRERVEEEQFEKKEGGEEEQIEIVRIHDSELKMNGLLGPNISLKPIEFNELIAKKAKASDIRQTGNNNCFLLSSLSSILSNMPSLIFNVIKFDPKTVTFTFYDGSDISKKYAYVIDPSIVITSPMNDHKNALIFLFEKAFAIHRLYLQSKKLSSEQQKILNAWRAYGFDDKKTIDFLAKHPSEVANLNIQLTDIKNICLYKDYQSALQLGFAKEVQTILFGKEAHVIHIHTPEIEYIINDFLSLINVKNIDIKEAELLTKMFGSIDSEEAQYFIKSVQNTSFDALIEIRDNFEKIGKATKEKKYALLNQVLLEHINWLPTSDNIKTNTRSKIGNFIDDEMPKKRGLAMYTKSELKNYFKIYDALTSNQIVTIATNVGLGKDGRAIKYKGLYCGHDYSVINCYERNGRKYLVLYNPHGKNAREYVESSDRRLHAQERKNSIIGSHLGILSRPKVIENPALPTNQLNLNDGGFFELELTDLKNFNKITISSKRQYPSESKKH